MIISAPGKISIAGEWAILEPGNPGMVVAVDKRAYVKIEKSRDKKIHINIKDFGIRNLEAKFQKGQLRFPKNFRTGKKVSFLKSAIETVLRFLQKYKPFKIYSSSRELGIKKEDRFREIGLGSSAAIVVATVAAVLKFHGINIKKEESRKIIYKLSALAHYLVQEKLGSGFDIAASTFGGIFLYKRFNPQWLLGQIEKEKNIRKIVKGKWPGFYFKKLNVPAGLKIIIGWTGEKVSTSKLIKRINNWKIGHRKEFNDLIQEIVVLVKKIVRAWREENRKGIIRLIAENEEILRRFGKASGAGIETKILKKMASIAQKIGGGGKLSGAGGGDCGIAITFDKKIAGRIKKEWRKNGIYIVDAGVSFSGVKIEN
ncbi:MAG: phosphomevalonate kinase [Patescibacteria group bacterium]